MASFKNIKIKMKGGKSRLQRVKVLASGKHKFVKNLKSKSSNPRPSGKKASKVKKKVAKKKSRRRNSFTIPMATLAGFIGSPAVHWGIDAALKGNWEGAMKNFQGLAGISWYGDFNLEVLAKNLGPIVAGLLVSKFIGGRPLNVNRKLASAGIPFIRL